MCVHWCKLLWVSSCIAFYLISLRQGLPLNQEHIGLGLATKPQQFSYLHMHHGAGVLGTHSHRWLFTWAPHICARALVLESVVKRLLNKAARLDPAFPYSALLSLRSPHPDWHLSCTCDSTAPNSDNHSDFRDQIGKAGTGAGRGWS